MKHDRTTEAMLDVGGNPSFPIKLKVAGRVSDDITWAQLPAGEAMLLGRELITAALEAAVPGKSEVKVTAEIILEVTP